MFGLGAIFISLVFSYCYANGKVEYNIGCEALAVKDFEGATTHFSRSISWSVPFASYASDSAEKIITIAQVYEKHGKDDDAKYTYNMLRGALYSTGSACSPKNNHLKICNEKIAELSAKSIVAAEGAGSDFFKEKEAMLTLLNEKEPTDTFWSYAASVSFFGWVIGAVILIMKLFKNNVVNFNKGAIIAFIATIFAYIVWLVSMLKA